jgi:hypothetical protein
MKKVLLFALGAVAFGFTAKAQVRYVDEVFTNVDFTFGTVYGQNYHFIPLHDSPLNPTVPPGPIPPLGYTPTIGPMTMDVYQPNGDAETERPLVIILHSGNFLPRYINRSATGDKGDSVIVELGNRFAKRGYVAATPRYRLGWNPTSSDPVTRVRTLLTAVYRAIHDVQTCVRFFKGNASTYKINPNKIVLVGVGSGGYVSNAYATLDKQAETALPKFQDDLGNSVIDTLIWGNVNGIGGTWNNYNHAGQSNSVSMCINMGGALGDISWMEGGEVPTIGFHCWKDIFAPYDSGTVVVPTTGDPVVDVHGTRQMVKKAVGLGNNDLLLNANFTDVVSARAYSLNAKAQYEGLFEFRTPQTPAGLEEGSPWDWWDSTTDVATATILGLPSTGTGANGSPNNLHLSGLLTNPDMSAAKGRLYVDTVMKFSSPRIATVLGLVNFNIAESNQESSFVSVFPNPVSADFSVVIPNGLIRQVTVTDLTGKVVRVFNNLNSGTILLERGNIPAGMYILDVNTNTGRFSRRVVFK